MMLGAQYLLLLVYWLQVQAIMVYAGCKQLVICNGFHNGHDHIRRCPAHQDVFVALAVLAHAADGYFNRGGLGAGCKHQQPLKDYHVR